MERIIDVAQYVFDRYRKVAHENIDEMKLHKLLYFCQRESYAILGKPMFREKMQGWRHGPVSPLVRSYLSDDGMNCETKAVSAEAAYIINNVVEQYAPIASWKLSDMTHREKSWLHAREGLAADQRGNRELLDEDIIDDASHVRPYDSLYDMYYDEFEDAESVAQ